MSLEHKLMMAMYQLLQQVPHETTHGQKKEKSSFCKPGCLACLWLETKKFYSFNGTQAKDDDGGLHPKG